ncbi:putative serine carboxypeptidase-like 52 [Dioscorea cayenensis subsp. rotundata]|uniref:Serine carboxypeptidase-like 52 n=1 Tax=Dioscorea cayennensis subsp. rotundata TaxID=55577 RepID=A0AB40CUK9_DIOCR|nr:putative serine carboxypeptidase-like 52 [Dioscorea cayenensis subsp. rotundata]
MVATSSCLRVKSYQLNSAGYLIGNPATGEVIDKNVRVPYAHNMGIISDEIYKVMDALLFQLSASITKTKEFEWRKAISQGWAQHVYCATRCSSSQMQSEDALHIQKGTVPEWIRCNDNLHYAKDLPSNVKYQCKLTSQGYRAFVYSGDHDLVVPHIGTQTWIRSLNYSIIDDWRSWFFGEQVAGYTRTYANNLTFATVKGAGHTVPEYKPRESLAMIKRWLSNQPL